MCQRYIFDGLEQDTAHSSEQFHSFYLQDHTKSVLEEIGDIKRLYAAWQCGQFQCLLQPFQQPVRTFTGNIFFKNRFKFAFIAHKNDPLSIKLKHCLVTKPFA